MNDIISLITQINIPELAILIFAGYYYLTKMERRLENRMNDIVEKSASREDIREFNSKIIGITDRLSWLEGRMELSLNSPDVGSVVRMRIKDPEE